MDEIDIGTASREELGAAIEKTAKDQFTWLTQDGKGQDQHNCPGTSSRRALREYEDRIRRNGGHGLPVLAQGKPWPADER